MTKASNISDEMIVDAVRVKDSNYGLGASLCDVQKYLVRFPPKVVQAKLKSAIKKGILTGCACGCRGDFEVV